MTKTLRVRGVVDANGAISVHVEQSDLAAGTEVEVSVQIRQIETPATALPPRLSREARDRIIELRGALADMPYSSEDYIREKREDMKREDAKYGCDT